MLRPATTTLLARPTGSSSMRAISTKLSMNQAAAIDLPRLEEQE
jgi:hypothetical protein